MKSLKILLLYGIFSLCFSEVTAQEKTFEEFSFNEFLGYVKKYHPLVKQANLKLNEAQAYLMKARGAFDPKIEIDFNEKQFKNKNYFSILNSSFKIPTWYGVELKASFDNSEGIYINPEHSTPNAGLTSVGISVPVGQGLWINQRMADIRKAKINQNINKAELNLQTTEILYQASNAYFNWKQNFEEKKLYETYVTNANFRLKAIKRLIEQGDKPAIDSVEASIALKNRLLNLENSVLKLQKASLELSNFLWLNENIPIELNENLVPEVNLLNTIENTLQINNLQNFELENHPKIYALNQKLNLLEIDKKLKANQLLPNLNVSYNYLSEPNHFSSNSIHKLEDYKVGLQFRMPLFLRKERADLKLAKIKLSDTKYELDFTKVSLQNKWKAYWQTFQSLKKQLLINNQLVKDYGTMLSAEERLFENGESSLFIINSRENSLVSSQLNTLVIEANYFQTASEIFRILSITINKK